MFLSSHSKLHYALRLNNPFMFSFHSCRGKTTLLQDWIKVNSNWADLCSKKNVPEERATFKENKHRTVLILTVSPLLQAGLSHDFIVFSVKPPFLTKDSTLVTHTHIFLLVTDQYLISLIPQCTIVSILNSVPSFYTPHTQTHTHSSHSSMTNLNNR